MNQHVRILSDLHLGHDISRIRDVEALRPLLEGVDTVIFNGDTWEELAPPFCQRGASMLAELKTLCNQVGVNPIFLTGNHDPNWTDCDRVELADGGIVVTHGDAIFFDGSPWKREIIRNQRRVHELWAAHPEASHDVDVRMRLAREIARELPSRAHTSGASLLQRAWDAAIPPQRALHMLRAWFTQGPMGAKFCDRYFPNAHTLIIGHFHHHGCWTHGRHRIINTGSFMNPGRAHWVDCHHGTLTRGVIHESPNTFRIGQTLDTWHVA